MYEIWGGNLDSQSFFDNGPPSWLEDCETLEQAREARAAWQKQNHAAWIQNKETREIIQ